VGIMDKFVSSVGIMESFVLRQNIAHYRDQLKTEADPLKQKTLKTLLTEAEANQSQFEVHLNSDGSA
jgi:hypothetical protein